MMIKAIKATGSLSTATLLLLHHLLDLSSLLPDGKLSNPHSLAYERTRGELDGLVTLLRESGPAEQNMHSEHMLFPPQIDNRALFYGGQNI